MIFKINNQVFIDNKIVMKIKELRQRKEITQGQLGKILGVSAQTILNWENGLYSPNINQLIAIADYFNVSLNYLVGRKTSKAYFVNEVTNELHKIDFEDLIEYIRKCIIENNK